MFVYEKKDEKKLYCAMDNVPTEDDVALSYCNPDGTEVELTRYSQLKDAGKHKMKLEGTEVQAWADLVNIIPGNVSEKPEPPEAPAEPVVNTPKKTSKRKTEETEEIEPVAEEQNNGDDEVEVEEITPVLDGPEE